MPRKANRETALAATVEVRHEVDVPALGGVVFVRPLGLLEQFAVWAAAPTKDEAESPTDPFRHVPMVLSLCVRDEDGHELLTAEEWARFCARHREPAQQLWNLVMQTGGDDAAKKDAADPS